MVYKDQILVGLLYLARCGVECSLYPLLVKTWCHMVSFQINQTKLPIRPVDSRVLSRGPDFTPAFADFSRQLLGGRGAPVSDASYLFILFYLTHSPCYYMMSMSQ